MPLRDLLVESVSRPVETSSPASQFDEVFAHFHAIWRCLCLGLLVPGTYANLRFCAVIRAELECVRVEIR